MDKQSLSEICATFFFSFAIFFFQSGAPVLLGKQLTGEACNNREFLLWWSSKNTVECEMVDWYLLESACFL